MIGNEWDVLVICDWLLFISIAGAETWGPSAGVIDNFKVIEVVS